MQFDQRFSRSRFSADEIAATQRLCGDFLTRNKIDLAEIESARTRKFASVGCLLRVWAVNSVIGRSNLFMSKSGKKISHICQRASQP